MDVLTRDLLDSLQSGILAVDLENRILFFNRSLERTLGVSLADWKGRPVVELDTVAGKFIGAGVLASRFNWGATPDSPRTSSELEFRIGHKTLFLREDTRALRDHKGRVQGRVFAFHDISREKEIDRMKTEFISVASHELRTPMTSIKGSVDLILSGYAGDYTTETQELLEIAQKSCDRLIRLINDILDLAKIEAREIRLKPVRMDLTETVERAMRGVKALADNTEVALRLQRDQELPEVEVDRDRIEQVVTNLLSNAIKFSPPNSEIVVELRSVEDHVQCSVIDQGCGIAEEDLPKVFGRFQQVGDNSKKKGGTGLGLAISRALVHEHHGTMWVESRLNEGARFIFRLPTAGSKPGVAAASGTY